MSDFDWSDFDLDFGPSKTTLGGFLFAIAICIGILVVAGYVFG